MCEISKLFHCNDQESNHRVLPPVISAALFAASPLRLGDAAITGVNAGIDVLHVDVMDGRFAPNITFGSSLIKALKSEVGDVVPLDVHLLVDDVDRYVEVYLDAGADILTISYESSNNPYKALETILSRGKRAGLAILPATPVSAIDELLPLVDLVLVMAVHPGESRVLAPTLSKLRRLRETVSTQKKLPRIGVDGGVKIDTLPSMAAAGADWIVAGSAVFGSGSAKENVERLRKLAVLR